MILQPSKYFVATFDFLKPIAIIFFSCCLIYLLYFSKYFHVTTIRCTQDLGEECQNDFVQAEIKAYQGQNLFLLDESVINERLYSGDPTIRTITLVKKLPGTLELDVQSVYPTLALSTPGSDRILVLDSQFRIIKAVATDPNVPLAIYDQDLKLRLGQKIDDPNLVKLFQAVLTLTKAFPISKQVTLRGDTLSLMIENKRTALFTMTRDLETQITALQSLLNNATIPEETAQIDLRYSQPVLRDKSSL